MKMKIRSFKRVSPIFAAVAALFCVFALSACSDHGAPEYDTTNPAYITDIAEFEQSYTEKLDRFMEGRENRTTYSDNEKIAAEYLSEELASYGYKKENAESNDPIVEIINFDVKLSDTETVTGRNVVAVYQTQNRTDSTKNVIIATDYDNRYSAPYKGISGTRSPGVLYNGTSVAAELYMAEYLMREKPTLDFDVTFVFFGGTTANADGYPEGSYKFLTELKKKEKHNNTVLFVELRRIGVDHVYAFNDARTTKREAFFNRIAADSKLDVYKPTQKSPALPVTTLEGVPFSQWVQGEHSVAFFNNGIPTLDITGGNYETINMTDAESSEFDNICGTEDDTLANLKRMYPDHAKKAATAVTLVMNGILDKDFLAAVEYDRENFPNTSALTMSWIWYLVVLAFVALCYGGVYLVRRYIEKKHPVVLSQPKNVKMAVFGMDYEDKNGNNIYIDIKPNGENKVDDEIFPGIPNNKPTGAGTPVFPVTPQMFDDIVKDMMQSVENQNDGSSESADATPDDMQTPPSENDPPIEQEQAESADTGAPVEQPSEEIVPTVPTDEPKETAVADKKPAPRKKSPSGQAGKSTSPQKSAARKTTSAPKSATAKKSARAKSEETDEPNGDTDKPE